MNRQGSEIAGLLFSLLGVGAAVVELVFASPLLGLPERWLGQALALSGLWILLSALPFVLRSGAFARFVYCLARFLVYVILVYPLGGKVGPSLSFLCALVAEAVMVLSPPVDLILPAAFVALSLIRPEGATAWDRPIESFGPAEAIMLAFPPLLVGLCLRLYRGTLARSGEQASLIERLKRSGLDLIDTNLVLQEKIMHQEARLLEVERSRISRELHDTIGYTLMNILAMQKAAAAIMGRDAEKARELIVKTVAQSERGLRDTRDAVGALRGGGRREATIAEAVTMLAKAFENTHIRISADLNNSAPSYGSRVDEVLVRFVQEAITNAIKHGNADEISINFWRAAEGVTVSVRDNGSGVAPKGVAPKGVAVMTAAVMTAAVNEAATEGMGIRGMRERFAEIGGGVSMGNVHGGFRISALVPASACVEGF